MMAESEESGSQASAKSILTPETSHMGVPRDVLYISGASWCNLSVA